MFAEKVNFTTLDKKISCSDSDIYFELRQLRHSDKFLNHLKIKDLTVGVRVGVVSE